MSVAIGQPVTLSDIPWYRTRRWQLIGSVSAALLIIQVAISNISAFAGTRPNSWSVHLADPINDVQSWATRNRNSNPVLANVVGPLGDFVVAFYEGIRDVLLDLPWFWLPLLVALCIARSGRYLSALGAAAGLVFIEVADLHKEGMETIALMLICTVLAVAIGGPLGIWAGLNPKVERRLRPILDALQSIPATLYLVVALVFFGIKQTPAAVATVAFAIPPMIRITALGIRQVPVASVEAGQMFGSSKSQLLWKIQAPQAVSSFVTAINQTIMMCLGMVVLGSLVGAGGLGAALLTTLRVRSPGQGAIVGIAVFSIALAFDRLFRSLIHRQDAQRIPARIYWAATAAILAVSLAIAQTGDFVKVPWTFDTSIAKPVDDFVKWIRDTFGDQLQTINDFIVRDVVIRLRDLLSVSMTWPVLIALVVGAAFMLKGWKTALLCFAGLIGIGLVGMWKPALETLAQVVVAVIISIAIAVPVGIFVGRRPRLEAAIEPLLDALQTFPSLIFAIPFVMIFAVGYVPGILATVLYAVPPGIRLTALAIKQVNHETLEAASTFGATNRQRMWGVHVPLALRGIALGINQLIMLAMAMVIIAGLVGGGGLGFLAVSALITQNSGQGVELGIALLIMAIILDRLSEGFAERLDPTARVAVH